VLPTLREGAPLTATPPVVSLDASNSRPQPSGALSPGPDVAPPVAPPVEYGAVDYSHEEDTEIMLDKLELGEVPHAIPDSCAAGHAAPSDGGPAASPPVDSGDGASDGSPQASPSSSGQVGLGCEAHGGQNPPHAGGEGVEALGPVPLSSMVYLTEDAEDIDDSVSVVSGET